MTFLFIIIIYYLLFIYYFRRDFFTPTNNRCPCFFNEGALRRIRMPDSRLVPHVVTYVFDYFFLLVRIDSLLVYVWRVATYSHNLLDERMIHEALLLCTYGKLRRMARSSCVRIDHCDIFIYVLILF